MLYAGCSVIRSIIGLYRPSGGAKTLIIHGLVATLGKENRVIQDGAIMIEDGKIA
jgi:hypothetical protein